MSPSEEETTASPETAGDLPQRPDDFSPDDALGSDATTLTSDEANALLREGKEIIGASIKRLVLTGEYPQPVVIKRCHLDRLVIANAHFRDRCCLGACTLYRPRFTDGCVFEQGLDWRGSDLRGPIVAKATVNGTFRMDNATVRGLRVHESTFESLRTWQARFTDWVTVADCTISGKADLRSFHADEGIEFPRCRFLGDFLFRGSTVAKKLSFPGSRFEGAIDLSKAKLHDFAYLEDIEQGETQSFRFHNAIFDRLLVNEGQLAGRLASENEKDHATAAQEYGSLKRNFEALNRYDDEDWAFYRFKVNQRRSRTVRWWQPWRWIPRFVTWLFLDAGCGYGARPFRAVASALVIMVLFAVLYAMGIDRFEIETPPLPDQPADSLLNRAVFGATASVSVFTAGLAGEMIHAGKDWMLLPLTIEALLGTLLWGLFIVAFSRKVIR